MFPFLVVEIHNSELKMSFFVSSFHFTRRHPFPVYRRDASARTTWRRFRVTTSTKTGKRRWRRDVTRSRRTRRRRAKGGWERSICRKRRLLSFWRLRFLSELLTGIRRTYPTPLTHLSITCQLLHLCVATETIFFWKSDFYFSTFKVGHLITRFSQ